MKRLLFKKQSRLLTPKDYQRVFKAGIRQRGGRLTFVFVKNALPYARLGLAITKRAIPHAVGRNRTKRIIREGFRHHQAQLAGFDVVVMTNPSKGSLVTYEELSQQWKRLLASQKIAC